MTAFALATFRRAWLRCAGCEGWCLFLRRWWGFTCRDCGHRVQADGAEFRR